MSPTKVATCEEPAETAEARAGLAEAGRYEARLERRFLLLVFVRRDTALGAFCFLRVPLLLSSLKSNPKASHYFGGRQEKTHSGPTTISWSSSFQLAGCMFN